MSPESEIPNASFFTPPSVKRAESTSPTTSGSEFTNPGDEGLRNQNRNLLDANMRLSEQLRNAVGDPERTKELEMQVAASAKSLQAVSAERDHHKAESERQLAAHREKDERLEGLSSEADMLRKEIELANSRCDALRERYSFAEVKILEARTMEEALSALSGKLSELQALRWELEDAKAFAREVLLQAIDEAMVVAQAAPLLETPMQDAPQSSAFQNFAAYREEINLQDCPEEVWEKLSELPIWMAALRRRLVREFHVKGLEFVSPVPRVTPLDKELHIELPDQRRSTPSSELDNKVQRRFSHGFLLRGPDGSTRVLKKAEVAIFILAPAAPIT